MAFKVIKIPRAPKSAFDKERDVSTLLQSQVAHVAEAERRLPVNRRSSLPAESPTTEHEAAEYIGKVMKRLHPKARRSWRLPPGKRPPKSGVWLGPARVATAKRKRKAGKKQ